MARRNWDKTAEKEFAEMDKEWQADWADLHKRVARRHLR